MTAGIIKAARVAVLECTSRALPEKYKNMRRQEVVGRVQALKAQVEVNL